MTREDALQLLKKHNRTPFLIRHAITVEAVLRHFANELGFGNEADHWAMVGLLHDIDFEEYPDRHCQEAPGILREAGFDEGFIHNVTSHAHGVCEGAPEPEHLMEKVLFAADELTGLIGAAALMRPSKSAQDMELSSLKKKFKDKSFAAGCSRDVIREGAARLGWELDDLMQRTLDAMKASEAHIEREAAAQA
ncbi:MAG TPA: hydrolase [Candidatus Limnocylindria bacterium]|nr:hydrolase [Candidatus Limnocylindria bacterium]